MMMSTRVLKKKKSCRSWSGVLPISIALEGQTFSCRYDCAFCPNEHISKGASKTIARSYLSNEGTFLRGNLCDFSIIRQLFRRCLELYEMGHPIDKLEIIYLGGTWDCYPKAYTERVILETYYAMNLLAEMTPQHASLQQWLQQRPFQNKLSFPPLEQVFSLDELRLPLSLKEEQERNMKWKHGYRIISLVIETRPDQICKAQIFRYRRYGCTRIQLGIQHTDNDILSKNQRGHTVEASIKAISLLRQSGFKIDGHLMPDLPFSSLEKDEEMLRRVFLSPEFQLDYVKIYPCLDLPYTRAREWKKDGKWKPYAETHYSDLIELTAKIMSMIPPWTRVNRVHRDFPKSHVHNGGLGYESETIPTNFRQMVEEEMKRKGWQCHDIRSREIKHFGDWNIWRSSQLWIRTYQTTSTTEYFISVESPRRSSEHSKKDSKHHEDTWLLGFARLSFPFQSPSIAHLRELHVYGPLLSSDSSYTQHTQHVQHRGIGTFLLHISEWIAFGIRKDCHSLGVISGIGVRQFYQRRGYSLRYPDPLQFMWKSASDVSTHRLTYPWNPSVTFSFHDFQNYLSTFTKPYSQECTLSYPQEWTLSYPQEWTSCQSTWIVFPSSFSNTWFLSLTSLLFTKFIIMKIIMIMIIMMMRYI